MSDIAAPPAPALIPPPRAERAARLVNWAPVDSNPSLVGRASIAFPGGWIVSSIPIFKRGDGALSAGVPSTAVLDETGCIRMRDGKRTYTSLVSFESGEAKQRWSRLVLDAVHAAGIE